MSTFAPHPLRYTLSLLCVLGLWACAGATSATSGMGAGTARTSSEDAHASPEAVIRAYIARVRADDVPGVVETMHPLARADAQAALTREAGVLATQRPVVDRVERAMAGGARFVPAPERARQGAMIEQNRVLRYRLEDTGQERNVDVVMYQGRWYVGDVD